MSDRPRRAPRISIFDIFIGSGRTIRRPTGPPGFPLLQSYTPLPSRQSVSSVPPADPTPTPTTVLTPAPVPVPIPVPVPVPDPVPVNAPIEKVESVKAVSQKDEPGKDEPGKDEPKQEESKRDEPKEDSSKQDEPKTDEQVKEDNSKKDEPKQNAMADTSHKHKGGPDITPFTPDEDDQLLALKAEQRSWKDISEVLGKPHWQLKTRFKELNAAGANTTADKPKDKPDNHNKKTSHEHTTHEAATHVEQTTSPKPDSKLSKKHKHCDDERERRHDDEGRKHSHSHRTEERKHGHHHHRTHDRQPSPSTRPSPHRPHHHRPSPLSSTASTAPSIPTVRTATASITPSSRTSISAHSKVSIWLELNEDDDFSFEELQILTELMDEDIKRRWERVASAFYNRTGRRVSARDVRGKMEGGGRGG